MTLLIYSYIKTENKLYLTLIAWSINEKYHVNYSSKRWVDHFQQFLKT